MKKIYIPAAILLLLISGCGRSASEVRVTDADLNIVIWDPEELVSSHPLLPGMIARHLPDTEIWTEPNSDRTREWISDRLLSTPEDGIAVFIAVSNDSRLHIGCEWNLWMPQIWRSIESRGKVLIADAPWGDEFLNPLKSRKADTVWAVNGALGHLRPKLGGSLLAASCRFDEINILSRGICGDAKTPLLTWYFLDLLCGNSGPRGKDLAEIIRRSAELTATAAERGVISKIEEVLFYNRSEMEKDEFLTYPHPVVWNGLAGSIIVEAEQ